VMCSKTSIDTSANTLTWITSRRNENVSGVWVLTVVDLISRRVLCRRRFNFNSQDDALFPYISDTPMHHQSPPLFDKRQNNEEVVQKKDWSSERTWMMYHECANEGAFFTRCHVED
jgi:hypothetical protein